MGDAAEDAYDAYDAEIEGYLAHCRGECAVPCIYCEDEECEELPFHKEPTMTTLTTTEPRERALMPAMRAEEAHARYAQIMEFVSKEMKLDKDYGMVPGTTKPTLLKPGAEKLCTFFGLTVEDPEIVTEVEDWTGEKHGGEPLFYYKIRQRLTRCGELVASQIGSCNSWEKKYRYREMQRVCPKCGKPSIFRGKPERGGGWYCWAKKGGCGANFREGDQAIESQQAGQIINKDIADQVNTVQKMAQKRALIAAVLIAANASEFFTQDLEDIRTDEHGEIIDQPKTDKPKAQPTEVPAPPNGSAQEAKKITPEQFETLCTLAKAYPDKNVGRQRWLEVLQQYRIKKMEQLPACYFTDTHAWLLSENKATPEQAQEIYRLARELSISPGTLADSLQDSYGSPAPEGLRADHAQEMIAFLTQKQHEAAPA